jgi:hypothetical protein
MDQITQSLLDEFKKTQSLQMMKDSDAFERLGNFCVLSKELPGTFSIEDVSMGGGNDIAIDGLAIAVNGNLVTSVDEVDDLAEQNKFLDVAFTFIQSKTSSAFSSADVGNFCFGVEDFFSEKPKLPQNDSIKDAIKIKNAIFAKGALFTRGKPLCRLHYVTTGKWQNDANVRARLDAGQQALMDTGLFERVEIFPVDANGLFRAYQATKTQISRDFQFNSKTLLPGIDGVEEAYLGVLPVQEYLQLITDDAGNIIKSIFYDNIRDFQGDNDVNKDIAATLKSATDSDRFVLLNNGVTLIARALRTVGNRFFIEDYQVVNGCQTSHVLFNERASLGQNVYVPIKVISTKNDAITSAVIKCTNSQTEVRPEQLHAWSDFQKKLEALFIGYPDKKRLYYERRSQQYNSVSGIEKVRITSMQQLIRAFSSMFLDEPHRATRSYARQLQRIGTTIFGPSHQLIPYYASAFAYYKLEYLFRSGQLDPRYKAARYQLLMAVRHIAGGSDMPAMTANKMEDYCDKLLAVLWDDKAALDAFQKACEIIDKVAGGSLDTDLIRTEKFTNDVLDALQ